MVEVIFALIGVAATAWVIVTVLTRTIYLMRGGYLAERKGEKW